MEKVRLFGVLALFCVAIALGGVWYELHQMRLTWEPTVHIAPDRIKLFDPPTRVEIIEPVKIESSSTGIDVNVQR